MYDTKKTNIYLIAFTVVIAIIALFIIKNFIIPIIFTAILVYLFNPMYKKLKKILKSHIISSFLTIILILIIIITPLSLTIWNVNKEFNNIQDIEITTTLEKYSTQINEKFNTNLDLTQNYNSLIANSKTYLNEVIIKSFPIFLFNLFIIMFLLYYFQKNYEEENCYIKMLIEKTKLNKFSKKIEKLLDGIIYGQLFVRIIQASIGTILFLIIGINGAIIWGILLFFAAFIPTIGTGIIWIPLLLINILKGNYTLSLYILTTGIIVSTLDNLLLPYIISTKTNIGPVTTLISIIGGIQLFGIYGIILGPFFLGLLFLLLEEFFFQIKIQNPNLQRYIWSENERKKYKDLKTDAAKKEFERLMRKKQINLEQRTINKTQKFTYKI